MVNISSYVLKPCPFCGSRPKVIPKIVCDNKYIYYITCPCGLSLTAWGINRDRALSESIKKWNKRC